MIQSEEQDGAKKELNPLLSKPKFNSNILIDRGIDSNIIVPQRQIVLVDEEVPEPIARPVVRRPIKKENYIFTQEDSIKFNLSDNETGAINWELDFSIESKFKNHSFSGVDSLEILNIDASTNIREDKDSRKKSKDKTSTSIAYGGENKIQQANEYGLNTPSMFYILLFPIIVIGYLRITSYKYIRETFLTFLFPTMNAEDYVHTNLSNRLPSRLLYFLFFFNGSIFLYQLAPIIPVPQVESMGLMGLLFLFILLGAIVFTKHFFLLLVGYLFNLEQVAKDYLFQFENIYKVFGVISIPFITFIPFGSQLQTLILVKSLIVIFFFFYLVQMLRVIRDNFTSIFSLYYIILYLCALEIAPLTLIYKVLFK